MKFNIKKAGLKELDTTAELFNVYRFFYRHADDYEKCRQFIKERIDNDQSNIFVVYVGD